MVRCGAMGVGGIAIVGALVTAPPGAARSSITPPSLTVGHGTAAVTATRGSYCATGTGSGATPALCADSVYPLPTRRRLTVRPRWRLTVDTVAAGQSLSAHLVRVRGRHFDTVGGSLAVRRVAGSVRRWVVTLPASLHAATVLDASVRYVHGGDGDFWAGLR